MAEEFFRSAKTGTGELRPRGMLAGVAGLISSSLDAAAASFRPTRTRPGQSRWDEPEATGRAASRTRRADPVMEPPGPALAMDPTAAPEMRVRRSFEPRGAAPLAANESVFALPRRVSVAPPSLAPSDADLFARPGDAEARVAPWSEPPCSCDPVHPEELAAAILQARTRTLVVVDAIEGRRGCGSADLARALAGQGAATMLLDLGFDRIIAEDLGIDADAAGLSDFLTGRIGIASIIQRDATSSADAIVWGADETAGPIQNERLAGLFALLGKVYDCIVIAGGAMPLTSFAGLLDESGAAVVATEPATAGAARERILDIAPSGRPRCFVMAALPRASRRRAKVA